MKVEHDENCKWTSGYYCLEAPISTGLELLEIQGQDIDGDSYLFYMETNGNGETVEKNYILFKYCPVCGCKLGRN